MTLVGPSARCQQRRNLTFTQRTARSLHPSRRKERFFFEFFGVCFFDFFVRCFDVFWVLYIYIYVFVCVCVCVCFFVFFFFEFFFVVCLCFFWLFLGGLGGFDGSFGVLCVFLSRFFFGTEEGAVEGFGGFGGGEGGGKRYGV